jgi:GC-rich sequence DNA-binding factor
LTKLQLNHRQRSIGSSPLSRTISESSRPTYSTAHLNELKSLTLSSLPNKSNEHTGDDDLIRSKFAGHEAWEEEDASFVSNHESVHIPTSNYINSAKERRSQARKIGLPSSLISEASSSEDFISLSAKPSSLIPSAVTKSGESRLVREEDQFGEGDDEHAEYTGAKERVPLGEKAGLAAEANKKAGMKAMIMDAEVDLYEGNEEEMEWEAAQIRRGGIGNSAEKTTNERKEEIYKAAPIPEHAPLASLASVENGLLHLLSLVEESVAEQNAAALQFTTEEDSLAKQEAELRQEVSREVERADFFEDLNRFVKEIDLFFTKKWPQLEKVEQDLISILKERADMISKRRYEDLSDDLVLFKDGEISVLRPSSSRANESEPGEGELESEVDELGRSRPELDISPHAPSRTVRRNGRKSRRDRRMAVALADNATIEEDDEGFSTDDSLSPADSSDLQSASRCLHDSGKAILVDITNPVFLSPTHEGSISDRFLSWKSKYPEEYGNAFGSLALVQAWEFWVRVEVVTGLNIWGLREWVKSEDKRGIENWEWMRGLEKYEHAIQSGSQSDSADNQESVIAAMISTVVIPLLLPIIKCSYDPFSSRATTKSLQLAEQVSYVLETDGNPTYDKLIKCFLDRFRSSVAELKRLVGSSRELSEKLRSQVGVEGIQARKRFLNKSLKLFKQGIRWKQFFNKNYWIDLDQLDNQGDLGQTDSGASLPLNFKHLLVHHLLLQIVFPILSISWETGGHEISQKVCFLAYHKLPKPTLISFCCCL